MSDDPLAESLDVMGEAQFWDVIAAAGGSADGQSIHRIWLRLRALPEQEIVGFDDRLAEVLRRLDQRVIAKQKWRDVSEPRWLPRIPGISADGFLYARCAAVLQGPETVAAIVADPRRFRTRWDESAESLLFVASEAWEAVTGRTYEHQSPIDYETGSNPDGGWE